MNKIVAFLKLFINTIYFFIFLSSNIENLKYIKMKKALLFIAISISLIACDKKTEVKEFKTAYVDTAELMKEYTETKDLEAKYKAQAAEKGRQLEAEISRFKQDAAFFQQNAQANGQEWAQKNGAALQRREQQLAQAQQALQMQLQQESGKEMDSLVKGVKKFIKEYGKQKGYAYIYGTGDAASILYAEEKYDITKDIVKLLNDKYKSTAKTEEVKK